MKKAPCITADQSTMQETPALPERENIPIIAYGLPLCQVNYGGMEWIK